MSNVIGLDAEKSKQISGSLNELLSNYQLFYINTRGLHWNIAGEHFFELHLKFEELYTDAQVKIDEIAERILTLGHTPLHSFTAFLEKSSIQEHTNITDGRKAVQLVVESFGALLQLERQIANHASKANDEGTNGMMSDYIREQEKTVWMLQAFLK